MSTPEHRPEPVEDRLHVLTCRTCGAPVRQWQDGRMAIHAQVPEWVKRAQAGTLPVKDLTYKA